MCSLARYHHITSHVAGGAAHGQAGGGSQQGAAKATAAGLGAATMAVHPPAGSRVHCGQRQARRGVVERGACGAALSAPIVVGMSIIVLQEWEALSVDTEGSPMLERRDLWGFSDRSMQRIRLHFGP